MKNSMKARKQIKAINPRQLSQIRLTLKFQKAVAALRTLVDAMEEISVELVANEKYNCRISNEESRKA